MRNPRYIAAEYFAEMLCKKYHLPAGQWEFYG